MLWEILLWEICLSICLSSWTKLIISKRSNICCSILWRRYFHFILCILDINLFSQLLLISWPYSINTHVTLQVIVRQSVDKAEFDDSSVDKITKLLFNHCESEEEGVRNVVAECLGKIALIEPGKLVPALKVSYWMK